MQQWPGICYWVEPIGHRAKDNTRNESGNSSHLNTSGINSPSLSLKVQCRRFYLHTNSFLGYNEVLYSWFVMDLHFLCRYQFTSMCSQSGPFKCTNKMTNVYVKWLLWWLRENLHLTLLAIIVVVNAIVAMAIKNNASVTLELWEGHGEALLHLSFLMMNLWPVWSQL